MSDLRADLTAAFDKVSEAAEEKDEEEVSTGDTGSDAPEDDFPDTERNPAEDEGPDGARDKLPTEKEDKGAVSETRAAPKDKVETAPVKSKAPMSWRPEAKESWHKLPAVTQQAVLRREREIAKGMEISTEARRHKEDFDRAISPFMTFIAAENSTPLQATVNMMQAAAMLRVGSAHDKASFVARTIKQFGVDLNLLDNMLAAEISGQAGPQAPAQMQLPPEVVRRLQYVDQLQAREQQQLSQVDERLSETLEEFASNPENEFYEDLREDIADILEQNAKRGRSISLRDAYDRASMLHPTISRVVSQRSRADKVAQRTAATDRARNAAVSVSNSGAPSQSGSSGSSGSLRQDLEAAFDKVAANARV